MWPSMPPAALNACASNSNAVTALAARWQTAVESRRPPWRPQEEAAVRAAARLSARGGYERWAGALEALYWERANELWKEPSASAGCSRWPAACSTSSSQRWPRARTAVARAVARAAPRQGGGHGEGVRAHRVSRASRAGAEVYPGGGNPFRGLEFTTLRAEQVVIPEEEQLAEGGQQQQAWDGGEAVDVGDEAAAEGGGGDGGGGAAEAGSGAGEGTAAAAGGGGRRCAARGGGRGAHEACEEMERLTKVEARPICVQ